MTTRLHGITRLHTTTLRRKVQATITQATQVVRPILTLEAEILEVADQVGNGEKWAK